MKRVEYDYRDDDGVYHTRVLDVEDDVLARARPSASSGLVGVAFERIAEDGRLETVLYLTDVSWFRVTPGEQ